MLAHSSKDEVIDASSVVATKATTPSLDIDQPEYLKTITGNDSDIILLAHERYKNSKILEAYRLLQTVKDKSLLTGAKEQEICNVAIECQNAISDLIEEPDHTAPGSVWKKQGESHGEYDTTIFYKVENKHLTCRLVTPIQSKLLIPLISVLNESNLYSDWIPSWTIPFTMGIRTSNQHAKIGALDQIVHLVASVPWPFLPREVYIQTMVIDEIDEHNYFAVRLFTVYESDERTSSTIDSDGNPVTIPAPSSTTQRFDFSGVLLFRPIVDEDKNSETMEVSFKMCVDPKISVIPTSIINFVTRTVIGTIWGKFLHVAKEVQNNERIHHMNAIQQQPELYQYIEQRVQQLLLNNGGPDRGSEALPPGSNTKGKEGEDINE